MSTDADRFAKWAVDVTWGNGSITDLARSFESQTDRAHFARRLASTSLTEAVGLEPARRRSNIMRFLFTYRMPVDYQPGGPKAHAAWNEWFEAIGANLEDRGNPIFEASPVGNCATGTKLGGYSLVTSDDLDTALSLTKGCPMLAESGGIVVGVITETTPAPHALNSRVHRH